MAFDYLELSQTAVDLLSEFGKSVTLVAQSTSAADPQKPWRGNDAAEKETIVFGVIIPIKESGVEPQTMLQRDATAVCYVASQGNGEVRGNHFLDESLDTRWRILDIVTYAPGPTPLMHVLFIAR
jgi:hypothetical protein